MLQTPYRKIYGLVVLLMSEIPVCILCVFSACDCKNMFTVFAHVIVTILRRCSIIQCNMESIHRHAGFYFRMMFPTQLRAS